MILKINNLNFSYGEKKILSNVDIYFKENKIYGLIGNNGVGKTTLFNLLKNTYKYKGTIKLDNKNITNNDIMMIHSIPNLPEYLTGREYLKYFLKLKRVEIDILEIIKLVNFKESDLDKLIKEYSHGMKNKIELLTILIVNPKIILLDEPLSNIDIITQEEIKVVLNILKQNHIIIISTHIIDLAFDLCDEIILMNNTKLTRITKNKNIILKGLRNIYD